MTDTQNNAKLEYNKPKLMVYGGFSQLTAGGSGTVQEGAMMTNLMRFP